MVRAFSSEIDAEVASAIKEGSYAPVMDQTMPPARGRHRPDAEGRHPPVARAVHSRGL